MSGVDSQGHRARGSFHGQYLKLASQRDRRAKYPRLLDCLLFIAPWGTAHYLTAPDRGEFAVLDLARREKGFFELPLGATPDELHSIIEGHFGMPAERVSELVWVV